MYQRRVVIYFGPNGTMTPVYKLVIPKTLKAYKTFVLVRLRPAGGWTWKNTDDPPISGIKQEFFDYFSEMGIALDSVQEWPER